MNKLLSVLSIITFFLIGGILYTLFFAPSSEEATPTPSPEFPTASGSLPGTTPTSPADTLKVSTADGGEMEIRNFIHDEAVVVDQSNPGSYYLAGEMSPDAPDPAYTITYKESDRSFNIALWQEPLKDQRMYAEQDLLRTLQISKEDACRLRYSLLVPYSVSPEYASRNLGFSFCPNAIPL